MTERINTNAASFTSGAFTPTSDFSVQAAFGDGSKAYIDIEGQVDAAAPWVALGTLSARLDPPIARFAKCPTVRLRLYNNDVGVSAKAWSSE